MYAREICIPEKNFPGDFPGIDLFPYLVYSKGVIKSGNLLNKVQIFTNKVVA